MINEDVVYKIKFIPLSLRGGVDYTEGGKEMKKWGSEDAWVHGFNVIPKLGGSGKTFTNKKLADRMLDAIKTQIGYGVEFKCEIVKFNLTIAEQ